MIMTITDRVRNLCETHGLTINKLEIELGIGRGKIGRWQKHRPNPEELLRVANRFEVSAEYLLTGIEDSAIREYNEAIIGRIQQLCAHRGTYIADVEKDLGFIAGTINGWKLAKSRAPMDKIEAIAKLFRVPTQALTGVLPEHIKKEQPALSEKRQAALEILEKLSDAQIDALLKLLGE
jgi:transcriptional regulator with XRE-family HTH domain